MTNLDCPPVPVLPPCKYIDGKMCPHYQDWDFEVGSVGWVWSVASGYGWTDIQRQIAYVIYEDRLGTHHLFKN